MSWRIEQADPLALLRELPDRWAQTCITSPPRELPIPYVIAVLDEVRRVLRDDGTLWLALTRRGDTASRFEAALAETAWEQQAPAASASYRPAGGQLVLLAKQPGFLYEPSRALAASRATQSPVCPRHPIAQAPGERCRLCRQARRAWCVPPPGAAGLLSREAVEWCIVASTVPRACCACGTPWRRAQSEAFPDRPWRTMCRHTAGRGRCLVIDPFCSTGETGIAAVRRGRDFLGIETSPANAATARKQLAALGRAR
jgi:hypothetical protein